MEERHLSLSEAADALNISERTAYRWIKSGKLRAYKPGRDYWIPESAIKEAVEESLVRPKASAPSPEQQSFNQLLAEDERRKPEYLREQLRERDIEINNSEALVLAQYIETHENPPPGIVVYGHVAKEGEPVDHERVLMLLSFVLATGMLSPEQTEAVGETLREELAGARS
jgi:excisionase family DNA binding protein